MLSSKFFSTCSKMKLSVRNIQPTGKTHSGTVIFLHGSGDTGGNLIEWIKLLLGKNLEFPHIKVVVPTAPLQPYTPMGGEPSNVWFDRLAISNEAGECKSSLAQAYDHVKDLIKAEESQGIPPSRIVIGGFSMGGCLAMHAGFHLNHQLAGVFAMSSFLNKGTIVYDTLKKLNHSSNLPSLLMFHGNRDTLVPLEWGRTSYDQLQELGVKGDFRVLNNTLHELKTNELNELKDWILKLLPPLQDDTGAKL